MELISPRNECPTQKYLQRQAEKNRREKEAAKEEAMRLQQVRRWTMLALLCAARIVASGHGLTMLLLSF